MKKWIAVSLLTCLFDVSLEAQKTPAYAFKNVQAHLADGTVQKGVSVVWRNGVIESVGKTIPFDAFVVADGGDSLHVYPGFIDGLAQWGSPETPRDQKRPAKMGEPPYDRAGIQPDRSPADVITITEPILEKIRKNGFTTFGSGLEGRVLPGKVDIFHASKTDVKTAVARQNIGQKAQFAAADVYPSTLMALMVTFRQLYNDATALREHQNAYKTNPTGISLPTSNPVLESLFPVLDGSPYFFVADSKEDIERVFKLQDEQKFKVILVSGKEAWMVKSELKKRNISVLASFDFDEKPKWIKDEKAKPDTSKKEIPEVISEEEKGFRIRQEKAYKEQLGNIKELLAAGVLVGYASNGMKIDDFKKKTEQLTTNGYSEAEILKVLTVNTATILGIGKELGDLKPGLAAGFAVYSKPISDAKTAILHHVSAGVLTSIKAESAGPAAPNMRRPRDSK